MHEHIITGWTAAQLIRELAEASGAFIILSSLRHRLLYKEINLFQVINLSQVGLADNDCLTVATLSMIQCVGRG